MPGGAMVREAPGALPMPSRSDGAWAGQRWMLGAGVTAAGAPRAVPIAPALAGAMLLAGVLPWVTGGESRSGSWRCRCCWPGSWCSA